ncbi:MAG: glycosyltransferase family 9 protein, partial [Bacteroidota bacterium]
GDIVVTTPIFRKLKKARPELIVGVVASPSNAELIRHDTTVDRIHVLGGNVFNVMRMIRDARRENYDVVLNFIFNRTTSGGILANLIAPRAVKVGQGAEKYRFYFNVLLQLLRGTNHMVEILSSYVKTVFGITIAPEERNFHIAVDGDSRAKVQRYLSRRGVLAPDEIDVAPFVVFNLSATEEVRKISQAQALELLTYLTVESSLRTIVISAPEDSKWRRKLVDDISNGCALAFPEEGEAGLREVAWLIGKARCVVTPDTSIIHISSAMGTPVLGFFTPLQVTAEWVPFGVRNLTVLAEAGSPVSSIGWTKVRHALDEFVLPLAVPRKGT